MVRRYGDVLVTGRSKHVHVSPYATNQRAAFKQCKDLLSEMGLTPAARARMRVANKEEDRFPWAKLIA